MAALWGSIRVTSDPPEPIQASVDAGAIGPDAAYQLTKVEDSAEQAELAKEAAAGRLKRDELSRVR